MKLVIIAIRDSAARAFNTPIFSHSTGGAMREFGDIANDPQHPVGKHPTDYEMYKIGEYDDQTAEIQSLDSPELLCRAIDLVRNVPDQFERDFRASIPRLVGEGGKPV